MTCAQCTCPACCLNCAAAPGCLTTVCLTCCVCLPAWPPPPPVGVAIASASLHYLLHTTRCLTLFVTHYPEVAQAREQDPDLVSVFHMAYIRDDDTQRDDGAAAAAAAASEVLRNGAAVAAGRGALPAQEQRQQQCGSEAAAMDVDGGAAAGQACSLAAHLEPSSPSKVGRVGRGWGGESE